MGRKDAKYRGTKCLNCNTPLDVSERYCHYCGQLNSTKKVTLSDFIEEFFSNFYAYDSKLRNSFISLFTKPGILAKRYNAGQRFTFANPFRLFLSVSIILFITFNLTDNSSPVTNKTENDQIKEADSVVVSNSFLGKNQQKELLNLQEDSIYSKKIIDENSLNSYKKTKFYILTFKNYHQKNLAKEPAEAFKKLGFENTTFNNFLYNKSITFRTNDIEEEIFEYFKEKLPFLIFISLPIITLIFWLVFYRKDLNYTEHLVFVYSFYTFVFLVLILTNLVELLNESIASLISIISFCLLFPYYLYRSLRNFYQFSRWKTLLKLIILHPLFFLMLTTALTISFIFGILIK